MGMWIRPADTVTELMECCERIQWGVKDNFHRSAQLGVQEIVDKSGAQLKGAAYDALRLRLANYESQLCKSYVELCTLLTAAYYSQISLVKSLFSGSSFSTCWDLAQIIQQLQQLQDELTREENLLARLKNDAVGLALGGILGVAAAEAYRNKKIQSLKEAIRALDERKAKMLAYNEQTKDMYNYANALGTKISSSATQLRKAVFNPATGAWEGISSTWISDLKKITDGVPDEIARLRAKADTPFDSLGKYGGNQSDTQNVANSLLEIIQKYYPDMTIDDITKIPGGLIDDYIKSGCAYMALANTLFEQYIGREEEFEKRFGFPLKGANGDYNFEMLVMDFFCSVGGRSIGGLSTQDQKSAWEGYIKSHNMSVNVHEVKITADNWEKVSQKGHIIVSISPVNMYESVGGKLYGDKKWRKGGHAMVITGVASNGWLKVSSWGGEYYINPKDPAFKNGFITYMQVSYP